MPTQDQVAWEHCNISVDGETKAFARGELLPDPTGMDEIAQRSILRTGGAIRTVEVVYTPEELAEQARERAAATAAREGANRVDLAAPMGDQVTQPQPGAPTLMEPSGSPVVIGSEDDQAGKPAARKPATTTTSSSSGGRSGSSSSSSSGSSTSSSGSSTAKK